MKTYLVILTVMHSGTISTTTPIPFDDLAACKAAVGIISNSVQQYAQGNPTTISKGSAILYNRTPAQSGQPS
jgi:hypothetical protein